MTVSPQWPQDGNRTSRDVVTGANARDLAAAGGLPPTLFRLPSLTRVPAVPPREPAATDQLASKPPATGQVAGVSPTTTSTAATAAPVTTAAPLRAVPADLPAGRSWMETLGSHGVVVMLLLVLVAAALVTGRHWRSSDTALSEHNELLDFDAGTEFDLPLPLHDLTPSSPEASGQIATTLPEPAAPPPPLQSTEEPMQPLAESVRPSPPAQEPTGETSLSEPGLDGFSHPESESQPSTQALVTLNTPQTPAISPAPIQTQGVQVNEFVRETDEVSATTVSKRVPATNPAFDFPSLEDLADQAPGTGEVPSAGLDGSFSLAATQPHTPRSSRTPMGIEDLLTKNLSQYIDQLLESVPTDADVSTSPE